ncbi:MULTISPECIES: AAA family ATPase [Paenibacillus]|uniref:AAA+ ATPase domain-containing protein n=1 Tax=Paenibacillus borealis TaxID=160799 RepID=A0ABX3GWP0_PAEBO|nr:AAA family ATPase [Paenibacillus borealis]OMD37023.1 hypothetical protein BSK56_31685 [Paenibacillus borealis]
MFIKKIHIGQYKKLNNFDIEFKKITNKIKGERFNISVLIGENGTAKSTILQAIANVFSDSKEKDKMLNYEIEYEMNTQTHKLNDDNEITKVPSNLVISSFSPVEKIFIMAKKSVSSLCPIIFSEMGNSKLKEIIGKYILENTNNTNNINRIIENTTNINKINRIIDYIGYNPAQYFLESNDWIFTSLNSDNFIKSLYNGHFDRIIEKEIIIQEPEIDVTSLITSYQNELNNHRYRFRNTIIDYMGRFDAYWSNNHGYSKKSILDYSILRRIYLEYIYILLKMRTFFRNYSKKKYTNYKYNETQLISNSDLDMYFHGLDEFIKDLSFLDAFEKYIFNDIWFEAKGTPDLVPLSLWSSGEFSLFLRLIEISNSVIENSIVLIDEPETHLHPKWIRNYIKLLKDIIGDIHCHVIIATHAPLIISDIPKESIIMLKRNEHLIEQSYIQEETIGLEYEEVLKRIFEFNDIKGTVLESYENKILESIEKDDVATIINLYDQLGDSPTKFDLFLKIKRYNDQRKSSE